MKRALLRHLNIDTQRNYEIKEDEAEKAKEKLIAITPEEVKAIISKRGI